MRYLSRRAFSFSIQLGAILLCAVLPAGCNPVSQASPAAQDPDDPDDPHTPSPSGVISADVPTLPNGEVHIDTRKPIPFDHHDFGVACYDTYDCKVRYNNFTFGPVLEPNVKARSSASYGSEYPDHMSGGYLGIRNFPLPAEVSWRDKDGNLHEAKVDIAAIFKNQVILHKVPQDQLPPILTASIDPDIVLEVNDRTINVWMRGRVPTKELQISGNIHSRFRDEMMRAYSKTY